MKRNLLFSTEKTCKRVEKKINLILSLMKHTTRLKVFNIWVYKPLLKFKIYILCLASLSSNKSKFYTIFLAMDVGRLTLKVLVGSCWLSMGRLSTWILFSYFSCKQGDFLTSFRLRLSAGSFVTYYCFLLFCFLFYLNLK